MTTDNTSAHLDGVCDKCFGWVGESDPESGEMGQCTACFGMARRAQPSEIVTEVLRLRALRDDIADAFDGLVMKVWRAAGEEHGPPADVEALLARVADDHKALVGFRRAMLDVHEALDGVRPEPDFDMPAELGSYACDEVARLQESRDALRAEVRQLRAAALHRRREGAEAMREACADLCDARARRSVDAGAWERAADALRALPLPGGAS